jgi:hypothetical protein
MLSYSRFVFTYFLLRAEQREKKREKKSEKVGKQREKSEFFSSPHFLFFGGALCLCVHIHRARLK